MRILACSLAIFLSACGFQRADPVSEETIVSDAVCLACHVEQSTYPTTAHYLTSRAPSAETILGSFREGENLLLTADPRLHYRMEAEREGFFQSAVIGTAPDTTVITEQFGIVVGSGRKGQTYFYWRDGSLLYQLPVSYWTELDDWVHSPRLSDDGANFERAVNPRCLECHAAYFPIPPTAVVSNQYDSAGAVLGISCQTCHGGGRDHVAIQESRIAPLFGQRMVNPARLSRRQQVEACALCHGGVGDPIGPAFTYLPGDRLADHVWQPVPVPGEPVDVHGNQVALLARSACFQRSEMTCSTCHDVHETQRDPAVISATCLSCHEPGTGLFPEHGMEPTGTCASCHMPELPSNTIVASHAGDTVRATVRTHWIRAYSPREFGGAGSISE